MTYHSEHAHSRGPFAAQWSLTNRDKKRLKRILVLWAAIILLLSLLYQLAQYTAAIGAERNDSADGDWKRTVHVDPGSKPTFSVAGAGKGSQISGKRWRSSSYLQRTVETPYGDVIYDLGLASLIDDGNRNNILSGFDTDNFPFVGHANSPVPWNPTGGGVYNPPKSGGGPGGQVNNDGAVGNLSGDNAAYGQNGIPAEIPLADTIPDGKSYGNQGVNGIGNEPGVVSYFYDPLPFDSRGSNSDGDSFPGSLQPQISPSSNNNAANTLAPALEVPEPASIAIFGAALLALITVFQHRRRRSFASMVVLHNQRPRRKIAST